MIKAFIAAVALSTLCIPQVEAQAFNEVDLLEYHESKGGKVYANSDLCKETGAMGIQQGINVHICIEVGPFCIVVITVFKSTRRWNIIVILFVMNPAVKVEFEFVF